MITTRARIHRANQYKAGWKREGACRAAYRNLPVFQWLSQRFQRRASELRQFVEEKHAVVTDTDFTRGRLGRST